MTRDLIQIISAYTDPMTRMLNIINAMEEDNEHYGGKMWSFNEKWEMKYDIYAERIDIIYLKSKWLLNMASGSNSHENENKTTLMMADDVAMKYFAKETADRFNSRLTEEERLTAAAFLFKSSEVKSYMLKHRNARKRDLTRIKNKMAAMWCCDLYGWQDGDEIGKILPWDVVMKRRSFGY